MSKEKMEMSQKKDFCPSSTLRWFQSAGAGELGAGAGLTKK